MKLREEEAVLHQLKPVSKVLVIWFFTKVLAYTVASSFFFFWLFSMITGIFGLYQGSDDTDGFVIAAIGAAALMGVCFILSLVYVYFLRGTYEYFITNQRCIFVGGIVRYRERSIPYHKITDVERSQNIIERVLGVSSIRIFTPGTSSSFSFGSWGGQRPELVFEGLESSEDETESINLIVRDSRDLTGV